MTMTLKQAKRFYDFAVGQIALDIHGNLVIRTFTKMYAIPSESYIYRSDLGRLCAFWINKKNPTKIKNVGTYGDYYLNQFTEANVDYLWEYTFGSKLRG